MIADRAKRRAAGRVKWAINKLLAHADMAVKVPEAALSQVLPSAQQCCRLAEGLGAALIELERAPDARKTAFHAAPGSASLPWQDVPDRAGWWWWDDGDNDTVMVLVRKDAEGELIANWQIYLNDSQHPCEAHVSRCLGWWAGPVEPPRSQLLGTTPNSVLNEQEARNGG
jgi:hypothetical protein